MLIVIAVLFGAFSVVNSQFLNCPWVNSLDCTTYTPSVDCGSDGVTYPNRCYLAQQICVDNNLHILHEGACLSSEASTTPSPNFVHGNDAVLDFFCTTLSHQQCGPEIQEVCATDGRTYLNYCEYDKARCTHRNLKVKDFGPCS
ncbi:follistatin-like isoform X3 [Ruditapes philippinarum]|uniref:follistatin-like isoform X3 n=1 Tax=Ruditapes philippinarum TaxID=129788 RepID=UPI00295AD4E3|nr:follistatin-like isoform X3 [Ruditapes philippinarum]